MPRFPGETPPRLAADFAQGEPSLAPFLGPSLSEVERGALPRAGSLLDTAGRLALVAALRGQAGAARGTPAQERSLALLQEEGTLAVLTGQQPGLFLGPLLTLHKAVSAVALARRLEARLARPVVPVFWIAAEDDDLSEIDTLHCAGPAGLAVVRLFGDGPPRERRAYASLEVGPELARAASEAAALLPPTEGGRRLAERLAGAAAEGTPVRAFARLLGGLLGPLGLVVADPSDPALKTLLAPLFAREIEDPFRTVRGAGEAAERLARLGYAAQVRVESDRPALFLVEEGRRARAEGAAARAAVAAGAARLVPDVLLRPVCQDALFPTVAIVAGPSEIAYLAQAGEAYARHAVPRPALALRLSAILVEPEVGRFLDERRPSLATLRAIPSALVPRAEPPAAILELERDAAALDAALARLGERLSAEAPPLAEMVAGARRKIAFEAGRVADRTRRGLDREGEALRRRVARARERLFPDGRLQERVLSPLPLLARWERLPEILLDLYDPHDARPLLVRLPEEAAAQESPRSSAVQAR